MNQTAFITNVRECQKLLKGLEILKKENYSNTHKTSYHKYSRDFMEACRCKSYYNLYRCALENDDYDFLLDDESFFQFSCDIDGDDENIRMAFYPSVCNCNFYEFMEEQYAENNSLNMEDGLELYQQFIIEQKPQSVTPLRYDYNKKYYYEKIHSSAHLHFGNEENIRVPTSKRLRPVLFVKIVIEYYYYDLWKSKIQSDNQNILYKKNDYEDLDRAFFTIEDEKIPYINFI